ncbi:hypothetical protein FB639_002589 [Coemansia asiatica]|nr:hypothetical protein FB639_002589 [Coemansia asiatica]
MVRKFDLSMLAGRWEKLGSNDLQPVFKYCTGITDLNINLCQNIQDNQLVSLFSKNPEICSSIENLDMSETMFSDKAIEKVIRLISKLDELRLNETFASTHTIDAIAETQGYLSTIELFDCDVSADQIKKLYYDCTLLVEIGAPYSLSDELEEFALEFDMDRCGEVYYDNGDDDDEDSDNYSDYDDEELYVFSGHNGDSDIDEDDLDDTIDGFANM